MGPRAPGGGTHRTGGCVLTPRTGGPRQPSWPSVGKRTEASRAQGKTPSAGRAGALQRDPSCGRPQVPRHLHKVPRPASAKTRVPHPGPRCHSRSTRDVNGQVPSRRLLPTVLASRARQRSPERAEVSPPGWGRKRGSGDPPEPKKKPAEAAAAPSCAGRGAANARMQGPGSGVPAPAVWPPLPDGTVRTAGTVGPCPPSKEDEEGKHLRCPGPITTHWVMTQPHAIPRFQWPVTGYPVLRPLITPWRPCRLGGKHDPPHLTEQDTEASGHQQLVRGAPGEAPAPLCVQGPCTCCWLDPEMQGRLPSLQL